jgi:hypothetical protein
MKTLRLPQSQLINEQIQRQIKRNVVYYTEHPQEIDSRLDELEREWSVERKLEVSTAILTIKGIIMGLTISKRWFIFTTMIECFLFQRPLKRWGPMYPLLRRFGCRTQTEIEHERNILKALRGDFESLGIISQVTQQQFCAF